MSAVRLLSAKLRVGKKKHLVVKGVLSPVLTPTSKWNMDLEQNIMDECSRFINSVETDPGNARAESPKWMNDSREDLDARTLLKSDSKVSIAL